MYGTRAENAEPNVPTARATARTVYKARWKSCMPSHTIRSVLGGICRGPLEASPGSGLRAPAASATLTMAVVAFSRRRKCGRTMSRILSAVRAPSASTSDVAILSCRHSGFMCALRVTHKNRARGSPHSLQRDLVTQVVFFAKH